MVPSTLKNPRPLQQSLHSRTGVGVWQFPLCWSKIERKVSDGVVCWCDTDMSDGVVCRRDTDDTDACFSDGKVMVK